MKFAPYVTALLLALQVNAAPTDTYPNAEDHVIEERGENAWRSWKSGNGGAKLANGANNGSPAQPLQTPAQTPGIQFWGVVGGIGIGVKPGLIPRPQATAIHATFGGVLTGQPAVAAPTPYPVAQPYVPAQPYLPAQPYVAPQPYVPAEPAPSSADSKQPADLNSQAAKATSLSATTTNKDTVFCRRWPDTISSDGMGVRVFTGNTNLDLTCWTMASMEGAHGRVNQDGLWMKTNLGCYINEADISVRTRKNYQQRLNQCPPQAHWVGTMQSQYKREDCYSCPSLDCASQNLGIGPFIDLECSSEGETVQGSNLWYKQVDKNCFYPSVVFASDGFLGTKQQKCPKAAA